MLWGFIFLHTIIGTLLPEAAAEVAEKAISQEDKEVEALSEQLTLLSAMIEDIKKQNNEFKEFQERDFRAIKNELAALNQRYFEDKKSYLEGIQELQKQNLHLRALNEEGKETLQSEFMALQKQFLQEKNLLTEELQRLQEEHSRSLQLEVSDLDQRLFKEKQTHLEHIAALEQDLTLVTKKLDWLDESALKKFSCHVGDFVAATTLPQYETATELAPVLPIFQYRKKSGEQAGYAGIEFLWWKAYEGALDYAVKGQKGANPGNDQSIGATGSLKSATFAWAPGYRLYLGYRFPPDFWELEACYTYYHSSHDNKTSFPSGYPPNTVGPPTTQPEKATVGTFLQNTAAPVRSAKSSLSLNYNLGDLLLGRRFLATDALLLRLLVGATGAWIDQHFHYKYLPGSFIDSEVNLGQGSTVKGKEDWNFSGGGMRIGLDTDWFIGKGFSLLAEGSLALIFGSYSKISYNKTNNHVPTDIPTNNPFPQVTTDLKMHDYRFVPHIQLKFMPAWGKQFGKFGLLVYAGYELNLFANLQEVYRSLLYSPQSINSRPSTFTYGMLGIQGLTAGLKFDF